jgi:CheY-like chemotaxis protein
MSRPIQIFLAEDNSGDVELVREALQEHHIAYHLQVASDGAEVKGYLARLGDPGAACPDLVLMDLNLPKAHGFELFELFRANERCGRIPVIVVTSSSAPKDRERAVALGAARYFRKPSELAEYMQLGSLIREVVEESGLHLSSEN